MMGTTILDKHGQPIIRGFNTKANKEKALETLLGLLNGLVADQQLDESELLYLDVWLREQEYIKNDPDVIDIIDCTTQILSDGIVTEEELEDAKELINTVLQYRSLPSNLMSEAIDHLQGIVQGVIANRVLLDSEIHHLRKWLVTLGDGDLIDTWPGGVLYERIESILSDGVITKDEREDFLKTLQAFVGDEPGAVGGSTQLPVERVDYIDFSGRIFCLTGQFVYGPRKRCEEAIIDHGGYVVSNVTKKLNYLVLGAIASRDWAHTSFGRKIEKAVGYKSDGQELLIISEEAWAKFL